MSSYEKIASMYSGDIQRSDEKSKEEEDNVDNDMDHRNGMIRGSYDTNKVFVSSTTKDKQTIAAMKVNAMDSRTQPHDQNPHQEQKQLENGTVPSTVLPVPYRKNTYWNLIRYNRPYRLFMLGYIFALIGEWYSYVATISFLEEYHGENNPNAGTEIGFLIMIWLIPSIILFPISGVLSDSFDRRKSMIVIDLVGAVVTLGYLIACHYHSMTLVYIITFLRSSLTTLYEPCQLAIVPMMVHDDAMLKKAATLDGLLWSVMMSVGSALGGLTVANFGVKACFIVDSSAYLLSAFVIWLVGGTWIASEEEEEQQQQQNMDDHENKNQETLTKSQIIQDTMPSVQPKKGFIVMFLEGIRYLHNSLFGPLILLKFSAAAFLGALASLQVAYANSKLNHSHSTENDNSPNSSDSLLGILLASSGFGALLGSACVEYLADESNARSLQRGCIWAFLPMSAAYLVMNFFSSIPIFCICSTIIYAAVTVTWIESDLIFQLFSSSYMLGRVSSIDFALATSSEGYSAFLIGTVQDAFYLSYQELCFITGIVCFILFIGWWMYDLRGGGIGHATDQGDLDFESDCEIQMIRSCVDEQQSCHAHIESSKELI